MYRDIDQLCYLLYNPLVTPSQLINNVKLPEYQKVSVEKYHGGMKATLETSSGTEYIYYFDSEDLLERIISANGETKKVLFDRWLEAKKLRDRIRKVAKCGNTPKNSKNLLKK